MSNAPALPGFPQMVWAENTGSKPFSQEYANTRFTINPGQRLLIPWDAMCLWLGHPDAVDIDAKRRFRTEELERLHVKWGVYEQHQRALESWVDNNGHTQPRMFPSLAVYRIEDNERIITVVDDPEGSHLTPALQSEREKAQLQDTMEAMRAQMAAMAAQLQEMQSQQAAQFVGEDTRTDEPQTRPERKPAQLDIPITALPDDEEEDIDIDGDVETDSPERVKIGPQRVR